VLLPHCHLAHADVIDGLVAATAAGAVRADVVAVEARRIADRRPRSSDQLAATALPANAAAPRVISLTERRLSDPPP
jgi:hypothetical protein